MPVQPDTTMRTTLTAALAIVAASLSIALAAGNVARTATHGAYVAHCARMQAAGVPADQCPKGY